MSKVLSVLGSTGSIGRQTLSCVEQLGLRVAALTAGTNVQRMEEQCRKYRPQLAVMGTEELARDLKTRLADLTLTVMHGHEGLMAAASLEEADTVVTAVMGMVGLEPTIAAIERGKRIALANKETLVCAGEIVMSAARAHGAEIIPVDSEHSAIFQCLQGTHDRSQIKRLILTASGGPFFGKTRAELLHVTKEDALRHPNWAMGPKITIDSASMMNKGLEFIEAMRLYELPPEQVSIVIHRQSVIHSLVEFCDGAVLAQLGVPDMRIPIQYALTYPDRAPSPSEPLDLLACGDLTFAAPDYENFPCLQLAIDAAKRGGTACCVLSGANEVAVDLFLKGEIGFYDIPRLVQGALEAVPHLERPLLGGIQEADKLAREYVLSHK